MPIFHPDTIQTIEYQLSLRGYDVDQPGEIDREALHDIAVDILDREFTSEELAEVRRELAKLVQGKRHHNTTRLYGALMPALPRPAMTQAEYDKLMFKDAMRRADRNREIVDDRITTDMLDTLREVGISQETIDRLELEGSDLETLRRRIWPGTETSFREFFGLVEWTARTELTPIEELVLIIRLEEPYFKGEFEPGLVSSLENLKWDLGLARDVLGAKQSPQWKPPYMGLFPSSPGRMALDRTTKIANVVIGFARK